MSDPFQTLGIQLRCHYTEDELKAAYHEQAKTLHPDSLHGNTAEFVHLNTAYRALLDPAERLKALLIMSGHAFSSTALPRRIDLFGQTSRILEKCAQWQTKLQAAPSSLVKSTLLLERTALESELDSVCEAVAAWNHELTGELKKLDAHSELKTPETLSALVTDFTYLSRWLRNLRERKFQLSLA